MKINHTDKYIKITFEDEEDNLDFTHMLLHTIDIYRQEISRMEDDMADESPIDYEVYKEYKRYLALLMRMCLKTKE